MVSEKDIMLMKEFREKLKEIKERLEELRSIAKQFDDRRLSDLHLTAYLEMKNYVKLTSYVLELVEKVRKGARKQVS